MGESIQIPKGYSLNVTAPISQELKDVIHLEISSECWTTGQMLSACEFLFNNKVYSGCLVYFSVV